MPKRSRSDMDEAEVVVQDLKTFERRHKHCYKPDRGLKRHTLKFGKFQGRLVGSLMKGGEHVYYLRWMLDNLDGDSERWAKPYHAADEHLDAFNEWMWVEYQTERTRVIRETLLGRLVPVTDLYNIIASYL